MVSNNSQTASAVMRLKSKEVISHLEENRMVMDLVSIIFILFICQQND